MRYKPEKKEREMLDEVSPYIVSMLPEIVYKEGTPECIKVMHKQLIDKAFQRAVDEMS